MWWEGQVGIVVCSLPSTSYIRVMSSSWFVVSLTLSGTAFVFKRVFYFPDGS